MKVETYEIEEIKGSDASTMAADAAAIELIERLGLAGQKKLVNTETATRSAFRRMTLVEQAVLETLFPEKSKVEDFSTEIIPLRVLEVYERAKQDTRFVKFEVWHSRTRGDDPVLVGLAGELKREVWGEYISGEERFLIARWGEALEPFQKLAKEAKAAWIAARRARFTKAISTAKLALESLEADADAAFATGNLPVDPSL